MADLSGARIITTMFVNDQPQTAIEIVEGVRKHRWVDLTKQLQEAAGIYPGFLRQSVGHTAVGE